MQTTYRNEDVGASIEISEYRVLAVGSALGFNVQVAEWEGRPMLLFRGQSWKGRQPRFAITPQDDAFAEAVHTLLRLGVAHERSEVTLHGEEPICLAGLGPIPEHHTSMREAWAELTGA